MTVEQFSLLRNIGQFDSVNAGARIPLAKLSLVYGENGRGKTTIAAILRSLSANDPELITERKRLGAQHPPHIVLNVGGATVLFQNGSWSAPHADIAVFDDAFVAANVCSGIEIETAHRQNLHELILGAQGVSLNSTVQSHIAQIEQHNQALRTKENAIPASARGAFSVDKFCALAADPDVDAKIGEAERNLSAAKSADAIRQRAAFAPVVLPRFDVDPINRLLARTLPDLEAEAAARMREHFAKLGKGGEAWVGEGLHRIAAGSEGHDYEVCPFCAQDLGGSPLIAHYRAYFSEAYEFLKTAIKDTGQAINTSHGGEVRAAFERAIRVASENREFWRAFTSIPEVEIDTAAVERAWIAAREAVLPVLRAKATAPLEPKTLPPESLEAIEVYHGYCNAVEEISTALQGCNAAIALVKEQVAAANIAALESDISRLRAIKARHEPTIVTLCDAYLQEKATKGRTEQQRDQARAALDHYRRSIFPAYETAINSYLQRFNAGFRLQSVSSVNTRGGSSASYSVVINNVPVSLTADEGPSFRNTLSAGDRNTLALAFFFASLDQDPNLARKIIVIDDPMTSLDEHRSLTTVQEMRRLYSRVRQIIVLSHSKPFLCAIWEGADTSTRTAVRIARDGAGSTLAVWDVRQDCITEHDRRHELVAEYLRSHDPAKERIVAGTLRPILETFVRIAYPSHFPPGALLGAFHNVCQQRVGTAAEILSANDTNELRALLDYANRFHHDTNAAWETAAINDTELTHFCERTIDFTRRP
ncbi:AAA family ATPase [Methylocystis parvus]|uniref:AAA family ATPase n=1 Tax=Methylocystis parvus TaxID=134 RepID=A0A6B8MER0_9HYPH|nr:AAA family ATPase [Methylocystis parvus]QGN00030.1 AAA family ATPase [Methylocystis parvus]WBK02472.1 AAA family ATPase [Methylocystis parvus OBBP]